MASNKENKDKFIVGGYEFLTETDAEKGTLDLSKIKVLETKVKVSRPDDMLAVYEKAIQNRIFKTPLGWRYLTDLREKLLESKFFRNIYNNNREKYETEDDRCYNLSIEDFQKLKFIFDRMGIRQSIRASSIKLFNKNAEKESKEKLLLICLKGFKEENIEVDLNKEIEIVEDNDSIVIDIDNNLYKFKNV